MARSGKSDDMRDDQTGPDSVPGDAPNPGIADTAPRDGESGPEAQGAEPVLDETPEGRIRDENPPPATPESMRGEAEAPSGDPERAEEPSGRSDWLSEGRDATPGPRDESPDAPVTGLQPAPGDRAEQGGAPASPDREGGGAVPPAHDDEPAPSGRDDGSVLSDHEDGSTLAGGDGTSVSPDRTPREPLDGPTDPDPTRGAGDPALSSDASTDARALRADPAGPPAAHRDPADGGGRRNGPAFLTLLLGGLLAGAIGYALAYYTEFRPFARESAITAEDVDARVTSQDARISEIESMVDTGVGTAGDFASRIDVDDLRAGLSGLDEILQDYGTRLEALEQQGPPTEGGGVSQQSLDELRSSTQQAGDAVAQRLEEQQQALAQIEERIGTLASQEDLEALRGDLSGLQDTVASLSQTVEQQGQAIEGARSAAQAEAARVSAEAAVAQITGALGTGEPFQDAVGAYEAASGETAPQALSEPAAQGVATLNELQQRFDAASRSALDASVRATAGESVTGRFGAFLRSQTGVRSLDEREGTGADAVLSRAQARVAEGDLAAALEELQALPPEGRDAMSDWIDAAQARLDAQSALDGLNASASGN